LNILATTLVVLFGLACVREGGAAAAFAPAPATTPSPSPQPSATPLPTPPTSPQVDRSLGVDGRQHVFFQNDTQGGYAPRAEANDIVVQPDGKSVYAGEARTFGTNNVFAFARLNVDGSLDSGFDGDGQKVVPVGGFNDIAYSVALQADGKIIAAGYLAMGRTRRDFAITRLHGDPVVPLEDELPSPEPPRTDEIPLGEPPPVFETPPVEESPPANPPRPRRASSRTRRGDLCAAPPGSLTDRSRERASCVNDARA
jgi:uncharacterized delta-60 repeat protein